MEKKRCCFAGHGKIYLDKSLELKVYEKCEELIKNYGVTEFWAGNYGAFDHLAARVVRRLKEKYPNIELDLVIPYITESINQYKEKYDKDYDYILMADMPENTPTKYKILKCNQYMVDCSDYLMAYVNYSFGGAVKTLEYAQRKKHIEIFNLGDWKE